MNIAITGATGNMGQAVVAALRDADCIDKERKGVREGKRVDLGWRRLIKKKKI